MNPFEHLRFGWGNRFPMVLQGEVAECSLPISRRVTWAT